MKRLALAALVVAAVGVVAGSALGSNGNNPTVIYDSAPAGVRPGNIPSVGPEAYSFSSLGDEVTFAPGLRRLNSVVVTMSSWACQTGAWEKGNCDTKPNATFSQPITLAIWNADHTRQLASSTQTFDIPYRPSASPECATDRPGGWYQASTKKCFNGLATDVTFGFRGLPVPNTVVYEISYDTRDFGSHPLGVSGPYDSLNIGLSTGPTVGSDSDAATMWTNGSAGPLYDNDYRTPAVRFNASPRLSRAN